MGVIDRRSVRRKGSGGPHHMGHGQQRGEAEDDVGQQR